MGRRLFSSEQVVDGVGRAVGLESGLVTLDAGSESVFVGHVLHLSPTAVFDLQRVPSFHLAAGVGVGAVADGSGHFAFASDLLGVLELVRFGRLVLVPLGQRAHQQSGQADDLKEKAG